MKMEHRAIIDNAKRHGVLPCEMAHELLVHDLVEAALFELRNIRAPYFKLNEGQQQEVIDRITEKAKEAAAVAVQIINARGAVSVPVDMKSIKVEAKSMTISAKVDGAEPNKHELTDAAGKLCLLVMAPQDYVDALDDIQPDRDQPDLPLHAGEIAEGLFGQQPDSDDEVDGDDPLYDEAVRFVTESRRASISAVQRKLKIGYNRAARLVEAMEVAGVVTAMDSSGSREVIEPAPVDEVFDAPLSHSLDDITQLVRRKETIDIAWLQSRFALSTDDATRTALQLIDAGVIAHESGESIDDYVYRVAS